MIRIDWKSLDSVAQKYVERLVECAQLYTHSYLKTKILANKMLGYKDFRSLILCPPHLLRDQLCPSGIQKEYFVTSYHSFFSRTGKDGENNAVWLTKQLNFQVCPYCNRAYTFTVEKSQSKSKRTVRPEIDHFFPKSDPDYMHLAISFYNLIPSCPSCNHLKSTQILDFHPYVGDLNKKTTQPKILVDLKTNNKTGDTSLFPEKPTIHIKPSNTNTQVLCLEELYEQHSDYAKELLDKIQAYNRSLYHPLIESFQSIGRTPEEIDRLIWGNYIEEGNFTKRPLSKMTHDILEQFGII